MHPNIFASFPRLYSAGSERRNRRISATTSSDARGGCTFCADGRMKGGRGMSVDSRGGGGLRSGDTGAVVKENGDGGVGGGR